MIIIIIIIIMIIISSCTRHENPELKSRDQKPS